MINGKRIGLAMLTRDEERSLPAALVSALPIIDTFTLVDTGSTDRTVDVARAILEAEGLPGRIVERPWVGFAHNRTELLDTARGTADYHLCLDADLTLETAHPLDLVDADAYRVRFAGPFEMWLPLVLKDAVPWQWTWRGAAHAYLDMPPDATCGDLPGLTLHETRPASPRADKYQRDAEALEAEISPRTLFYLAQTYRDLGHKREAADLYRLRIRHSAANPEETFWACYQEALLRLEVDGFAAGVAVLLEAWQRRPSRAEPLWVLAREHRTRGLVWPALLFAERAASMALPPDRGFVLRWVYDWGARMEHGLCLQAVGRTEDAVAALNAALKADSIDEDSAEWIRDKVESMREAR